MADEKETIVVDRKEAIASALAAAEKAEEPPVEEKKDDTTKVEESEKKESEKKEPTEAEVETQQALELFRALRDPARQNIVVDFLAKQAGYTKPPETKAEAKEVKDDIVDILKESLGDEFGFLADKLAPALEKVLTSKIDKSNEDIRKSFEDQQAERLRVESSNAINKLSEDFFGKDEPIPDNVVNEMSKLMDRYKPSPDLSVKEYIKDIFDTAVGRLGLTKNDKARQERTNKNRTDASSRLASERGPSPDNIREDRSKPLSRREAIRQAVELAEKGE